MSEEESEIQDQADAETRQVFNPVDGSLNYTRRRVTDIKENSKIHLPKPLDAGEEAKIEIRRQAHLKIFRDYRQEFCKEDTGE